MRKWSVTATSSPGQLDSYLNNVEKTGAQVKNVLEWHGQLLIVSVKEIQERGKRATVEDSAAVGGDS